MSPHINVTTWLGNNITIEQSFTGTNQIVKFKQKRLQPY